MAEYHSASFPPLRRKTPPTNLLFPSRTDIMEWIYFYICHIYILYIYIIYSPLGPHTSPLKLGILSSNSRLRQFQPNLVDRLLHWGRRRQGSRNKQSLFFTLFLFGITMRNGGEIVPLYFFWSQLLLIGFVYLSLRPYIFMGIDVSTLHRLKNRLPF